MMAKKSNLPAVVHDHFRKANKLHGYVEKELGEASNHALEIGQELLAAKKAIPHGSWEKECKRLFDGSARTARFYMAFTRDFGKLKTAEKSAVLMLEGTLDGAAKAAKKATKPAKPKPPKQDTEPIDADSEPVDESHPLDKVFSKPLSAYSTAPPKDCVEEPPTAYCKTCKTEKPYDDDGACVACREPGIGPAAVQEPADGEVDDETIKEPEAGTCLRDGLLGEIEDWRARFPDAPSCLVGSVLEGLVGNWESALDG